MDTMDQLSANAHNKMTGSMSPSPSTANAQLRKIKKPLIEKRRRERINECLVQLKALVLEAMNKDGSQYSKMEKADILEMTLAHLKSKCNTNTRSSSADSTADAAPPASSPPPPAPNAIQRYVSGYAHCAREVANYLSAAAVSVDPASPSRPVGDAVRRGLLEYLDSCLYRQTNCFTPGLAVKVAGPSPVPNPVCGVEDHLSAGNDRSWSQHADVENFKMCRAAAVGAWRTTDKHRNDGSVAKVKNIISEDECSRNSTVGFERLSCSVDSSYASSYSAKLPSSSRSRCDSGVYSGASSPTGDAATAVVGDEMTTVSTYFSGGGDWRTSPRRVVSPSNDAAFLTVSSAELSSVQRNHCPQQQVLNLTVRPTPNIDIGVWRPW